MAIPARIQNHECSSQSSQGGAVELYACLSDIVKLLLIVELFLAVSGLIWFVSVLVVSESIELDVFAGLKDVAIETDSVVCSSKLSSSTTTPMFDDGCVDICVFSSVLSLSIFEISVAETVLLTTVVDEVTNKGDDVKSGSMKDGVTGFVVVASTGDVTCLITDGRVFAGKDSEVFSVISFVACNAGVVIRSLASVVSGLVTGVVTFAVTCVVNEKVADVVTGEVTVEVVYVVACVVRGDVCDEVTGAVVNVVNGEVVCVVIEAVTGLITCSLIIEVDSTTLVVG